MLYPYEFTQYFELNDDSNLCGGDGVWLKENTPPEIVEKIRVLHESAIVCGSPYMILDFLAEDIEKGLVEQRYAGSDFYRKGTRPPNLDLAARRKTWQDAKEK